MLPAFLRWPAARRCRHPAPDAAKFIAQAIGTLQPETLMCADGITNALLSQQQGDSRDGAVASAGATKREAFENLAQSFAAETISLSDSEADQLISGLLVVIAATNGRPWTMHCPSSSHVTDARARRPKILGVWSDEYRRGSHALYMSLMGRRWAGTSANALARRARLHDPSWLPPHAELTELMGLRAAADCFGGMGGWMETPPPRTRNVLRASLWAEHLAKEGNATSAMSKLLPVEEAFGRLDPLAHKTFTFLHWFAESHGYCQLLSCAAVMRARGAKSQTLHA